MKRIFSLLFCAAALFNFVACSDDDDNDVATPDDGDTDAVTYYYTLNSGSKDQNNSSLTRFDVDSEDILDDLFTVANDQKLGDTANDILVLDDQIYITVTGSNIIFVTDLEGTITAQITNDFTSPRYLATDGEYVYASYYVGLVKIDPSTNTVVASTSVASGYNPEEIVLVDGNLYVAMSDYYVEDKEASTINVYDTEDMSFTKGIELLVENPSVVTADDNGNLYVISMGNYITSNATLQKIDLATDEVEVLSVSGIDGALPTALTMGADDILYVIEGVTDYTTWISVNTIYAYDTTTGSATEFITDGTTASNMYKVCTDKESGDVFVSSTDYTNTGDVHVFNADGTLKAHYGVGLNPMKTVVISIEE